MTEFICRLGTPSGEIVTRIVEANAASEARSRLESEGFRVLRFSNNDVMENLEGIIAAISLSFQEREGARSRQRVGRVRGLWLMVYGLSKEERVWH